MSRYFSKALILGGNGFVGRAIGRALKESGVDVASFGSADVDLCEPSCVEFLKQNLGDGVVLVFASAKAPVKNPMMLQDNIKMMTHVFQAVSEVPPEYLLYVSSDAVFGDEDLPLREETIRAPGSLHGVMHLSREIVLESLSNVSVGVLRPTLVYGAGDPHNGYGPNRFVRLAKSGEDIILFGKGEERRDHVWIKDVGEIGARMVQDKIVGSLNAASGETISFRAIAEHVVALVGSKSRIIESERHGPMPHNGYRPFDVTNLKEKLPGFLPTSFLIGLENSVREWVD